ncbi:DUF2264 domain-containing protein [Rapidithrix thailandica]|uniref:DUF2264 domain-containing protein n=1 Tax=Rapidithrix thailandica TaxID=413964 RepID=A0AAW9SF35_9BACT
MKRRDFTKVLPAFAAVPAISVSAFGASDSPVKNKSERDFWVETIQSIADPLLKALAKGKLKEKMPVEARKGSEEGRKKVTYLEAFGRLLAGMAPWLELGEEDSKEGKLREKYIRLVHKATERAVNPKSPDFMNFTEGYQPLVDAAFLAHAFLRAPKQLWERLDDKVKQQVLEAMRSSREITPWYNNWLLFSATIEAFFLKFDQQWDEMRVDYAVRQHLDWYKGDGMYGDGPDFHWDYYNSFVIQPMLLDIVKVLKEKNKRLGKQYETLLKRSQRYAAIQERLISPEGTFPPIGRSLPYRFGAFQLLGQIALEHQLPKEVKPAQVRGALTAVIRRMIQAEGTFDKNGWLKIGFCGHQPDIAESYISTGSLYLCSVGLLPLGLPENDPFWTAPAEDWTAKKVWKGVDIPADHALYG